MKEQDIKNLKDVYDIIDKYLKLQAQIDKPTNQGMIEALSDAQSDAFFEVRVTELQQGDYLLTPWDKISDDELYRKLYQYQLALKNRAISLVGEKVFEELLKNTKQ